MNVTQNFIMTTEILSMWPDTCSEWLYLQRRVDFDGQLTVGPRNHSFWPDESGVELWRIETRIETHVKHTLDHELLTENSTSAVRMTCSTVGPNINEHKEIIHKTCECERVCIKSSRKHGSDVLNMDRLKDKNDCNWYNEFHSAVIIMSKTSVIHRNRINATSTLVVLHPAWTPILTLKGCWPVLYESKGCIFLIFYIFVSHDYM